jgi:hypothetical protein
MRNVTAPKCDWEGCTKVASFGDEVERKRLRCGPHATDKMVNLCAQRCKDPGGCTKAANFNKKGLKAKFCSDHAKPGMENVNASKCDFKGCKKEASFGDKNEKKRVRCGPHAEPGMVCLASKKCDFKGCEERALYNKKGLPPEYCKTHQLDGMVNVVSPRCKNELCDTIVCNDKYKGFCLRCYVDKFPNKPLSRNYKNKEDEVSKFIKSEYPELKWVTDRTIAGGFSRLRPDLLLDLGYQLVIIEIDEHQHVGYSCENNRLKQLSQDAGRPIVFIRFNPDQYTDIKMTRITSCWSPDGTTGLLTVTNSKRQEWETRLGVLKTQVDYWLHPDNKTTNTIELVQLFYDGFT